jgi:hypothetical protein
MYLRDEELLGCVKKLRSSSGTLNYSRWVIDHGERELHTRSVGAIGSVWEERRTLMTVRYGEHAQGLKPFGVAQECGNRDTQNPEFVRTVHRKGLMESDQPFPDS